MINSQLASQGQCQSDRSFVGLGLMLTQKVFSTKTKLKEINPTVIYQWDGDTLNNQISGKGSFLIRNSRTNELVFQCQVSKWKNGLPSGIIKMKKVNFFPPEQFTDYKVKEIHTYEGDSQNLKKNGNGTYIIQEFYSSGKVKKSTVIGEWNYDILVKGTVENESGKRELNLNRNLEWSRSTHIIASEMENPQHTSGKQKEEKQKESLLFKQNTNLIPESQFKQKYLYPMKIKK